jgi:hypothetical protein
MKAAGVNIVQLLTFPFCITGDKKAIEKTSQALREGQPKLRQKIVEMGGAAAMQSQFGHAGIFAGDIPGLADPSMVMHTMQQNAAQAAVQQQYRHELQQQAAEAAAAARAAIRRQHEIQSMQPTPLDPRRQEIHMELFQRMSIRDLNQHQTDSPHSLIHGSIQQQGLQQQHQQQAIHSKVHLPLHTNNQKQQSSEQQSNASVSNYNDGSTPYDTAYRELQLQQFSNDVLYGGRMNPPSGSGGSHYYNPTSSASPLGDNCIERTTFNRPSSYGSSSMDISGHSKKDVDDRRRVFAKMKYSRPTTGVSAQKLTSDSTHTTGDGFPDIHMVESSLSLYSNLSNMTDGKSGDFMLGFSNHTRPHPPSGVETVKVVDHSHQKWDLRALDKSSRHSIMSGLSIIDDTSVNSDLDADNLEQKLVANGSQRSIAMSEISTIDLQEKTIHDERDWI